MLSWDEPGKHPEPRRELVEGRVPSVLEQGVEGCDKPQCPSYGEPACFDTSFVTGLRGPTQEYSACCRGMNQESILSRVLSWSKDGCRAYWSRASKGATSHSVPRMANQHASIRPSLRAFGPTQEYSACCRGMNQESILSRVVSLSKDGCRAYWSRASKGATSHSVPRMANQHASIRPSLRAFGALLRSTQHAVVG
jgi:hypothetical protein